MLFLSVCILTLSSLVSLSVADQTVVFQTPSSSFFHECGLADIPSWDHLDTRLRRALAIGADTSFVVVEADTQKSIGDVSEIQEGGTYHVITPMATPDECKFSRDTMIKNKFNFYNENGFLGEMGFQADGMITGYRHDNEYKWGINGRGNLEFYHKNGGKTAEYISAICDFNSKWHFHGPFTANKYWKHYLRQI